jgi:hypothetical protein
MPKSDNSGMGMIIKVGLLAGGAYYIYSKYFAEVVPGAPVAVAVPGAAPTNPVTGAPITATEPAQVQNVTDLMGAYLATDPNFLAGRAGATFDEWNWARWHFQSAPQSIEDIFPGMDRSNLLTLDEYVAGLKAKGVAGLTKAGLGELGMILDLGDFFSSTPHRKIYQGNFR